MKKNMKKILIGVVVVIVLAVIFLRGDQLEELIKTIERGAPLFLIGAVVFQMGKYFAQGASFIWCFKSVGSDLSFKEGVKLVFATFFVDTVIPSFNMSGTSIVIAEAAHEHISSGKATGAALLRQVSINAGFLAIMVVGFAILGIAGGLTPGWIALGVIAILIVGGMVAAMAFAAMRPDLLLKLLAPPIRMIDNSLVKHKKKPVDTWVKDTVDTYARSATLMTKNKQDIGADLGLNVLASIFELFCFAFVALAFGVQNIEAMICGYVVVTLFAMLSFVPQGVGIVEAAALVTFALFGIDQATTMAVIMVYRAIVFWLPFLVGAVVIQRSKLLSEHEKSAKNACRSRGVCP